MSDNPYVRKDGDRLQITEEGNKYLKPLVTDTSGPVYAFTGQLSPLIVGAAMARLSRRGSDLREIILDEFAASEDYTEELLDRVVTAYGDDSVQQLIELQFVVEDASNLLTKALEWSRLSSYLEQSTRYIFFDQKDANGQFKYLPAREAGIGGNEADRYAETMDRIFGQYSEMVRGVTEFVRQKYPQGDQPRVAWLGATRAQACDAVRPVLPVATKSTVGIVASAQSVDYLVMRLLGEDLLEFRIAGERILAAARQVIGPFLKRTDIPERGGAMTAYRANTRKAMRELAGKQVFLAGTAVGAEVILADYWPTDERKLANEMLFEFSDRSITAAPSLSDQEVAAVYRTYFGERLNRRHKPGRAIEKAHYEWQITADYGTFRDIQRHRMVDAFEWQQLTPYLGYEVPDLVTEAGFVTSFRSCFELSEGLYEQLKDNGYVTEAQYATLLGHRMRYRFITNLRELFHLIELRTQPAGHPGYRRIAGTMYQQLLKVHPLCASGIKFVNSDEDPALTRMAAEMATQFKLDQMAQK